MVLESARTPLRMTELPDPEPARGQALLRVLHVRRLPHRPPRRGRRADGAEAPARPGAPDRRRGARERRQVRAGSARRGSRGSAGRAESAGTAVAGAENLCDRARFTGYDRTAGTPSSQSPTSATASRIPEGYPDEQAAPLLCAGLIGYRSLRLAGEAERIGLYGFGASAHIVCQVAVAQGRRVFAGTRAGDDETQEFARSLGAAWAGDALAGPPEELDAVIVFAPAGALVPAALRHVRKGGSVVCAGIHMSDIPSFPVRAALGRAGRSARSRTSHAPTARSSSRSRRRSRCAPRSRRSALEDANEALDRLRRGTLRAAAVLVP